MKQTHKTIEDLIQVWLRPNPPAYGRLPLSGGISRAFFEGDVLYSYGKHWPLARRIPERNLVLVCGRRHSNTTTRQMWAVVRGSSAFSSWSHLLVQDVLSPLTDECEYRFKKIPEGDAKVMARPTNLRAAAQWFRCRSGQVDFYKIACRIARLPATPTPLPEPLLPVYHACQMRYPELRVPVAVA